MKIETIKLQASDMHEKIQSLIAAVLISAMFVTVAWQEHRTYLVVLDIEKKVDASYEILKGLDAKVHPDHEVAASACVTTVKGKKAK